MSGELVIPVGYGLVRYVWSYSGSSGVYSHAHGVHAVSPSTAEDIALAAATAYQATGSWADDPAFWSAQWTLQRIDAYLMTVPGLTGASTGVEVAGTSGIDIPPANVSLLAPVRTTLLGRQFRGRMYLPNIYVSNPAITVAGAINDTQWAANRSRVLAWFAAITAASTVFTPYLLHTVPKATPTNPTPEAPAPTPIASFGFSHNVATQRRRLL